VSWKNDFRTPTVPPIRASSSPPVWEEPPDEAMVLRAMSPVKRGMPYICQEFRDDIEVVNERLVDRIDPPRFVPLVGPVQLHHCRWKCSVYYMQTQESTYPFPYRCRQPRVEVVYIDKDHLHLYPGSGDPPAELGNQDFWPGHDIGGVHGYQFNGGCPGCGCGQINYAPVTSAPNMQWGVGNAVPAPASAKPR
jgi:hypothetical protein